jgi:DNA-binding SARP family transcriptional activator/TolB-like protein/Tfp pilus assembly protein PilF
MAPMAATSNLAVRLLGSPAIRRDDVDVPLPRSRKVRTLLAFLALAKEPVSRSRLCDLLWDVPDDPKGELRWCLSKLRGLLDHDRQRVLSSDGCIQLDLSDCNVDALAIEAVTAGGLARLPYSSVAELAHRFGGELLEGEQLDGHPELTGWLTAERDRFRRQHVEVLRELVERAPACADRLRWVQAWLERAPFDIRAHTTLLELLYEGRPRDAETHLQAAIRSFEAESVDWAPLRDAWQRIREKAAPAATVSLTPARVVAAFAPTVAQVIAPGPARRASIAVMPFDNRTIRREIADGLTEDIIMQLAKLRVLLVIARGSVFSLAERGLPPLEAARLLGVDYVVSGALRTGQRATVAVELADARDGHIVWADALDVDEAFTALDAIVRRIVAGVAEEIEATEARRAVLRPPGSLDAWAAYHRGLWHMYKFTGSDNHEAEKLFRVAIDLDPTFARAHAGRSFTHFQNVFLDLTADRDDQLAQAYRAATDSVAADDADPAAHWAMGRALWLRGASDESVAELERSVDLSPNFALGHYTLGFVNCQTGDPVRAIAALEHSRELSPFDPLLFAMLASRALAHVRLGELPQAAAWAVKATARPNAHAHILAIAAVCLALAERRDEAREFVVRIRTRLPHYTVEDYLRAFRLERDLERRFRATARGIGFGR